MRKPRHMGGAISNVRLRCRRNITDNGRMPKREHERFVNSHMTRCLLNSGRQDRVQVRVAFDNFVEKVSSPRNIKLGHFPGWLDKVHILFDEAI